MNFIRDEIVDKLMEQQKIFDIKYYLFNDIIVVVKFTIFYICLVKTVVEIEVE